MRSAASRRSTTSISQSKTTAAPNPFTRPTTPTNQPSTTATSSAATAIVFSWNDFLCPVEFFQSPTRPSAQSLAQLDECIVHLLSHARTFGPVFVLCEGGAAYMEALCTSCLPRCARLFASPESQQQIQLICAATSPTTQWHGQMLHLVLTQRWPRPAHSTTASSLAVFGKETMRHGCLTLAKHAFLAQPKVVARATPPATSMGGGGDVLATLKALAGVGQTLGKIVSHVGPIDIVV
ncbi:Aste57867_3837 [Aphanomyces stellatus]|uniref:Aste57867_3837 protein n=1 Tax=Aphanomyces stellatus TaxID=120398 RepID=A0A485KBF2_9STRA|nr:hypothetical protein As57867_003826 [Aphanomyces stellatus]VFT80984.1 Aste57867_3837 [Aphanomyces stellatus]